MKVRFWGVRGSIPTPITNERLQSKIAAVVQRIQPHDLISQETREQFLANLPPYVMGTVGGNTTCIEVRPADNTLIIFDGGSGIVELAAWLKKTRERPRDIHIFFSHFHWDHIQGLPFFLPPMFDPECTVHFYSPVPDFEQSIRNQMQPPYFPVDFSVYKAKSVFHVLKGNHIKIKGSIISWREMHHPGGCYAYSLVENNRKMIFSTDTELTEDIFLKTEHNCDFFENTDLIILDSQYTLEEAIGKYGWGHSSYSLAVDFSVAWDMKQLVLFHHEPRYDDKKLSSIFKNAGWYFSHMEHKNGLKIYIGYEGLEIRI